MALVAKSNNQRVEDHQKHIKSESCQLLGTATYFKFKLIHYNSHLCHGLDSLGQIQRCQYRGVDSVTQSCSVTSCSIAKGQPCAACAVLLSEACFVPEAFCNIFLLSQVAMDDDDDVPDELWDMLDTISLQKVCASY